jgi:rod shape-determining protein MreD
VSFESARPLNPWRWLIAPALLCILAAMIFAIPIRVFGQQLPEPVFPMICAFSWAVIRPSILAPIVLLIMGVLLDIFWGTPMGLWALSLLVAYAGSLAVRNMMTGQSRPMMWAWYAGFCAVAMLSGYLFTVLDAKTLPSLIAVFWQFLATSLLYPFAHRLIDRFEDADVRFR